MTPRFFKTPADFRKWLVKNHAKSTELWVGYYKAGCGKQGMTYKESVEEALCFGWIDGIRKSVDEFSYTNRFTPRKPTSTWSAINIKLVKKLITEERMTSAGLAAYKSRKEAKSGIYSYEKRPESFASTMERQFRRHKLAWRYFESQPAWYRRTCIHWVTSAKREETRAKRLAALISDSESGHWIGPLKRPGKSV